MTPEAMDRMAEAYFEAVCAGDAEGLRALFADDVRWRIPKGAIRPTAASIEAPHSPR